MAGIATKLHNLVFVSQNGDWVRSGQLGFSSYQGQDYCHCDVNTELVWPVLQPLSGCVSECMAIVTRKQVLNSMQRQVQASAETYNHTRVGLHIVVLAWAQGSKT